MISKKQQPTMAALRSTHYRALAEHPDYAATGSWLGAVVPWKKHGFSVVDLPHDPQEWRREVLLRHTSGRYAYMKDVPVLGTVGSTDVTIYERCWDRALVGTFSELLSVADACEDEDLAELLMQVCDPEAATVPAAAVQAALELQARTDRLVFATAQVDSYLKEAVFGFDRYSEEGKRLLRVCEDAAAAWTNTQADDMFLPKNHGLLLDRRDLMLDRLLHSLGYVFLGDPQAS